MCTRTARPFFLLATCKSTMLTDSMKIYVKTFLENFSKFVIGKN
jgi:hypothetical protein